MGSMDCDGPSCFACGSNVYPRQNKTLPSLGQNSLGIDGMSWATIESHTLEVELQDENW
jgi:hypothetical protein